MLCSQASDVIKRSFARYTIALSVSTIVSAATADAEPLTRLDDLIVSGDASYDSSKDVLNIAGSQPSGLFSSWFSKFSFCSDVGCLPGDKHRAQLINRWISRHGADRLEYGAVFDGVINTGRADPWRPRTHYRQGQQIDTNGQGDASIFEAISSGTSGLDPRSMPRGLAQSISDGGLHWRYVGPAGTDAKAVLGISGVIGPNGGRSWGIVNDLIMKPGAQRSFVAAMESDLGNESGHCELGRHSCYNIFLYGLSSFTSTALIAAGTPNKGPAKDYLFGLWLKGPNLIQDVSILDETESAIGLRFANGSHASGAIVDETSSPVSFHIAGSHSTASLLDTSKSANAILMNGQYGYSIINTQGAGGPGGSFALTIKSGQLVCFSGQNACFTYDTNKGTMKYVVDGQIVFSVDRSGNLRVKGKIMQGTRD